MKKLALFTALTLSAIAANAEYQSMVFRTAEGATESAALDGLTMKFADGNMIVTTPDNQLTLPLASLTSMEFSDVPTGVAKISDAREGSVTVYSIEGICYGAFNSVSEAKALLTSGTYILKSADGKTRKIAFTK